MLLCAWACCAYRVDRTFQEAIDLGNRVVQLHLHPVLRVFNLNQHVQFVAQMFPIRFAAILLLLQTDEFKVYNKLIFTHTD